MNLMKNCSVQEIFKRLCFMFFWGAVIIIVSCDSDSNTVPNTESVLGCTDPQALNYNELATEDDSSCNYRKTIDCSASNFTISVGETLFNGDAQGVSPGSTIAIEAGRYQSLRFEELVGDAQNPITIVNCGGKVDVGGPNANNAIVLANSKFVRITGSGEANITYGINILGSRKGSQGIVTPGFSTNIEIDHLEITNAGFAGIMVKTDPTCDPKTSAERGGPNRIGTTDFTMRGINIHDNYIHDVTGEAIYVGNSFFNGTEVYGCGVTQYPHEVRGVRVYNNSIDNTGWDGIQVGASVEDVEIYDNRITNFGLEAKSSHQNAIQVGAGTTGKVYGNFIKTGTGPGVFILGIGNHLIYNNVIVDAGKWGIGISLRKTALASDIVNQDFLGGVYIINNTIVNPGTFVLDEFVNEAQGNVFINNLAIHPDVDHWNDFRRDTDWRMASNLVYASIEEAGFTNPDNDNYALNANSQALNSGEDVSSYSIIEDFNKTSRPKGFAYDIGAYEGSQ